jgi:small subunit ribosomal protein S8
MVNITTTKIDDRIGDFINRLKNASAVNADEVVVAHTKLLQSVAEVLKKNGYLADYEKAGKGVQKHLRVTLAKPVEYARRVSKPSRRIYSSAKNAPVGRGGRGITVLSTPKGIMTSADAKQAHVGGEVLFTII